MQKLIHHLVCAAFLFSFKSAYSQSGISTVMSAALQNNLDAVKKAINVKGVSAAVYIPGRGMWKGVTGVSHDSVLIDSTTLFSIGSITKTFVAAKILRLIENGELSLNDSLHSLLPPITNVNKNITIRQLLGHKSGLSDYLNANWQAGMNANLNKIWYQPEAIKAFLGFPQGAPGSSFQYINTNYALLGMIIESKTGDSLHKVLRNEFFTPLGLNNTYMEVFEKYQNPIAHNWATPTFNPFTATDESATPHNALWSSTSAAGGLFSDAEDIAKWGYNLYSGKVLNQQSLSEMLDFTSVSSSYFNGYGLGCQRFPGNGRTYWGHAGNYFGYASCMLYYPQDSICVAVLINQDCYGATLAKTVINTALLHVAVALKETVLNDKVIVYPNPSQSHFTVEVKEGTYTLELIDATGKKVYEDTFTGSVYELNSERFTSGIYQLKINSGKRIFSEKVVIVR
jgi:D-alanyl-D-alanine carboxypeptidase